MSYQYFNTIGLQRSGTNWLAELILNNFDVERKKTFWKHLTPLGCKITKKTKSNYFHKDSLILRNDVFFIATFKEFNSWSQSLDRSIVDFNRTHNTISTNPRREVFDSWINWSAQQKHLKNFYCKNYLDWLDNWQNHLDEIKKITGWKMKHSQWKDVGNVPRSPNFDIKNYR